MRRWVAMLLVLLGTGLAQGQALPQRADGTVVLPDHFLRAWDPVTLLLPSDTGPADGGPEDAPDRYVTLTPPQPGAWTWLGPRTLQFRPAEAWPPLRRETVTLPGRSPTVLVPLLPLPVQTAPAQSDNGVAALDTFALTFRVPVDQDVLHRLIRIQLSPQPGLPGTVRTLTQEDFDLRPMERTARADSQTILVVLRRPIPDGQVATLRLSLSDEPGLEQPSFEMILRSAAPFTLTETACGGGYTGHLAGEATLCTPDLAAVPPKRRLILRFSSKPAALDAVRSRDALRITPPLDDLVVTARNDGLRLEGAFVAGVTYSLVLAPGSLADEMGRVLAKPAVVRFGFVAGTPQLAWDATDGIVERLGPQMVPMRGHGYDDADIRIFPVDPLSRDFWPFPRGGIVTQDDQPPPLPGNEPGPYVDAGPVAGDDVAARIGALGTPSVSDMMRLPIHRGGVDTKFGLDLRAAFARIAGDRQAGAYLVGMRTTDGSRRQWMRVQSTDLVLTTIEEAERVRFFVTSLATANPVAGAEIRLDGVRDGAFTTLAHGVTDAQGAWTLAAPLAAGADGTAASLQRFVVTKASDTLVLSPFRGPQQYAEAGWTRPTDAWLGWVTADTADRQESPQTLCHVFTERPIYRPDEPVQVFGMARVYQSGTLALASGPGEVVVTGPNDQEWRIAAPLDEAGGFHATFDAKTDATGEYKVQYVPHDEDACASATVKKEAYRLPTFEALLSGPERVPLDAPFQVNLLARFFAGGLLSARPVQWRVTQSPYVWSPPGRDGFAFSSDSRYAGEAAFRSTPVLARAAETDAGGAAQLTLDPTIEPTAQPRQYLVEATVTGDDDIQVRATRRITALPPFVLGVKVPRYLPQLGAVDPEILALDGDGKPVVGLPMTVRLVHRQWNSVLQASDFAQGAAKYQTQVVDETVAERSVVSTAEAQTVHFGVNEAGVYLVEVLAADKVGRQQVVKVDLFAAGETPVTWSRPPSQTVTLTADKPAYDPGKTATVTIQSPFQTARALAVIEEPGGRFRIEWIDVRNGFGRVSVPLTKREVPRLAVHVLLMRGRLPGVVPATAPFDQGKPVTLAASTWLRVNPVDNRLRVQFDAPAEARPGQAIDLVLHMADPAGHPLSGEATVWLVDQAVLSLAKEAPLDPLPSFVVDRPSTMAARDTRNMAFGVLPLLENPGGDENGDAGMANISVRKNFTPVPFYAPRVRFGADGRAVVHVVLPDSLTVFMLRAVAVSGADRFGFGTGQLRVRQPVIAQPALPRFVRPGDSFEAELIGRVVEGPGGAGRSTIAVENLAVQGPPEQGFTWSGTAPARIGWTVTVPQPSPGTASARIRMAVQRQSDRVGDAVQVDLPIWPDRPVNRVRSLLATGPSGLDIPALTEALRPASYRRQVTVASDPEIVRLVAGLGALLHFPIGGAEQRIALATGELALLPFTPLIEATGIRDRIGGDVAAALAAIKQATDEDGLVAFYPHTPGSVWLTADAYRMLVAADRLGQPVDKPMMARMAKVLTDSLRSDYPHLLSRTGLFERVAALTALADGGTIKPADAAELARRAQSMPTGAVGEIATVLARLPGHDERLLGQVLAVLWQRVNLLDRNGRPIYAGLTDAMMTAQILPSEARSLANIVQAVATAAPGDPRLPVVRSALVNLAGARGWGSTDATAAALRALAASWQSPARPATVTIGLPPPDAAVSGTLGPDRPLVQGATTRPGPVHVAGPSGLAVLAATDSVPVQPGWQAPARMDGFAVTRTFYAVKPGQPLVRIDPATDGALHLSVGDVVEEVDELVSPQDRAHVALHLPLAAGLEPLNPALATATADATPSAGPTVPPSWSSYGDAEVLQVWLALPKGDAVLRTRLRATVPGRYTAPPATAEMLYEESVQGRSAGQLMVIAR